MLNYDERQAEIKRLQEQHKEALSVPLMSEGTISPYQVGLMSNRQRVKWQTLAQIKMQVESQIRLLSRTDSEIQQAEQAESKRKNEGRINQIDSLVSIMSRFVGKKGKILPKYAKEIQRLQAERESILNQ